MTPATAFAGKTVALFGLGGSGLATARALIAGGAYVECWDDGEAGRAKATDAGLNIVDLRAADWSRYSSLILSPGVPLTHPEPHWTVSLARAAGVEIIGDIEVFFRERARIAPGSPVVAITGTNGKSTTTALIAHILKAAGRDVRMGGNIGVNILDLDPPAAGRTHVIEMSSFQIDLTPSLKPTVGVHINLTPDHLDRHGSMEAYAGIKERMNRLGRYRHLRRRRRLVEGDGGSPRCRRPAARPLLDRTFDRRRLGRGGVVSRMEGGEELAIASLSGIASLRGEHNAQNAAAAVAAALALGVPEGSLQAALRSYASLPHRMEPIGSVGRTVFINDSKATNADSTRGALKGAEGVFWILGGKAKEGGIEELRPFFGAVAKAYLIGAASDLFAATLDGDVPFARCGTLDVAVSQAAADAGLSSFPIPSSALAGLRLLRPVPELRASRPAFPRSRAGAAGDTHQSTECHDGVARGTRPGQQLALHGGPPASGRHRPPDALRHHLRIGGVPVRRGEAQPPDLPLRAPAGALSRAGCLRDAGRELLSPRYVRRLALLVLVVGMAMVVSDAPVRGRDQGGEALDQPAGAAGRDPAVGIRQAGIRRDRRLGLLRGRERSGMPGTVLAILLLPAVIVPLIMQPDIGQTMLVSVVWCALFFLAGLHMLWVVGLAGLGFGGVVLAYKFVPHVTARLDRFLNDKGSQDSFQIDASIESFASGGLFGKGPGEGTVKRYLPDAHTDFIFAVTGEEFGVVVAVLLVCYSPSSCSEASGSQAASPTLLPLRRRGSPSCSACRAASTWR